MRSLSDVERTRALQLFANYPLLEHASAASIETIISEAEIGEAELGTRILVEGERPFAVTFLLEGSARIYHGLADGREFTPKILSAPNHFGDIELISGFEVNGQSVELLGRSIIAIVPWSALRRVLLGDHAACVGWLTGLASQFVYTIDADRHNVFCGLSGRIANVLLSYADVFRDAAREGIEVCVPLSLAQLAKQVGSVKRSILRVLGEFKDRGILHAGASGLVISHPEALASETLPGGLGLRHEARGPGLLGPGI